MSQKELKVAMLGMVEGNGHPYSWSAIYNGFDREAMAPCPYPVIPVYLNKQPTHTFGIPGAHVTHIWTDDPGDAQKVAKASLIPNIVTRPEDVIGEVDAVVIPTDKGWEHVERCRPFVEAGLPIFVDKPLVDNEHDLKIFSEWVRGGAKILSSSSMRYVKEMAPYRQSTYELGDLRYAHVTMNKSWERYGIHAMELVYPVLGPGFISVTNSGSKNRDIIHLKHRSGVDVVIASIYDLGGSAVNLIGTGGSATIHSQDTYTSFKRQQEVFVDYVRTGDRSYPFSETEELMRIIIAGILSRNEGGREVQLAEIEERTSC